MNSAYAPSVATVLIPIASRISCGRAIAIVQYRHWRPTTNPEFPVFRHHEKREGSYRTTFIRPSTAWARGIACPGRGLIPGHSRAVLREIPIDDPRCALRQALAAELH